ncbi:MAG: CpsD/CapB family tyrosine-protein kinase [Desulfobacteraceae bacterium]
MWQVTGLKEIQKRLLIGIKEYWGKPKMTINSSGRVPSNPNYKGQEISYSEKFMAKRREAQDERIIPPGPEPPKNFAGERYPKGNPNSSFDSENQTERIQRRKNRNNALPKLSKRAERQLEASFQHLSTVQGDMVSLGKDAKTIYITSCFDAEGKTTTAIHTAFALSVYGGANVLLIDGNLQSPQIHRMFSMELSPGLIDIFYSNVSFEKILVPTRYKGLSIVTAGSVSIDTPIPFTKKGFKIKLEEMRSQFDYIILDGNSILTSSEAATIAVDFDAVILVVACEQTKWEVVQMVQEKIEKAGASVLGVVLNKRRFYIPDSIYRRLAKR